MPNEQLDSVVEFTTPRRRGAADRARDLLNSSRERGPVTSSRTTETGENQRFRKVTGRVFPDQQEWFKGVSRDYNERHPRQPRLTGDELMRIAIEHLRKVENLDSVIAEHRV